MPVQPEISPQDAKTWRENSRGAARAFSDTLILVPVGQVLIYPPWKRALRYPEYERTAPVRYDFLDDVELQSHAAYGFLQFTSGQNILQHFLREHHIMQGLGYADALLIKEKGPAFYREFVGEDFDLYFWRGIVYGQGDYWAVPRLRLLRGELWLDWPGKNDDCGKNGITPHFKKV